MLEVAFDRPLRFIIKACQSDRKNHKQAKTLPAHRHPFFPVSGRFPHVALIQLSIRPNSTSQYLRYAGTFDRSFAKTLLTLSATYFGTRVIPDYPLTFLTLWDRLWHVDTHQIRQTP